LNGEKLSCTSALTAIEEQERVLGGEQQRRYADSCVHGCHGIGHEKSEELPNVEQVRFRAHLGRVSVIAQAHAAQQTLAQIMAVLVGGERSVELAAKEFRAIEAPKVRQIAQRVRRPEMLLVQRSVVVLQLLALSLTRHLLVQRVWYLEVGAVRATAE